MEAGKLGLGWAGCGSWEGVLRVLTVSTLGIQSNFLDQGPYSGEQRAWHELHLRKTSKRIFFSVLATMK